MVGSPSGPEPRRFAGCLVRNCGEHRETETDKSRTGRPREQERERGRQGQRNRETQAYRPRDRRVARADKEGWGERKEEREGVRMG